MKKLVWVLLITLGVVSFSSCNGTETKTNTNGKNANVAVKPEKTLKASIVERENQAYEAWKKKDGKFFEDFLRDDFVGVDQNGRTTKSMVSKIISGSPCEVKSFAISDENVVELSDGVVLLTAKNTSDYTCEGKPGPSPTWMAGIYVKDGDSWKAAYHQNAPTADAKGENPPAPAGDKKEFKDADKELTATLSGVEKGLWEVWAKKDTKPFEEALAENFTGFNAAGRENRAEALKNIAEHKCEVKSHSLSDFHTSKIADNVFLLTYKATTAGTCDGKPMPKGFWASTVVMKDGEKWKGSFHMSSPMG